MAGNGDSLRRVQAGDRAQIPADAFNAFLDVVRERRAAAFDGGAGAVRVPPHPPATVLVRNDTGGDLDRFAVVALGAPAVAHADDETEFFRRPNLAADAPEGGEAVFGVLLEPAADGAFAPAQVSGVCPVRVNVTSEAHTHASPVAGDTEMLGSDTAGVPVLWKESGTGTKWAYVLLGSAAAAGTIAVEAADGTPAYAGVTKVTFDQADGFSLSQPLGGVVAVDLLPATESQAGIVSTEGQRFGGHKTFADGLTAIDEVFVDEEEGAGEGGAGRLWLKLYRTMPGGSYGTATGSEGIVGLWESGMGAGGYPATYPCLRFIRPVLGDPGGLYKLMVHAPDRLHLHCQEIQINALGGGGDETGQTGTLTGGAVVTCGIVTDLGDGVIDGGTW